MTNLCVTQFLMALLICASVPAIAMTVQGVSFSESVSIGGKAVPALLRYLKAIKAYVAALYLPEGVGPEQVLTDVPKRLELSYLVPIKGEDFGKGAVPTLKRNQIRFYPANPQYPC